jgi:hypothetical protein
MLWYSRIDSYSVKLKKNYEEPPLIAKMIYINSSEFKTENGLYVGMPIKDVIKKNNKIEVICDEEDGEYHFYIDSMQKKTSSENDTIVFLIDIEFNNLMNNELEYIKTHLSEIDGKIVGFSIYYFN